MTLPIGKHGAGGIAQVVECLPSPEFNPQYGRNKGRKEEREGGRVKG
jgi:hypothetical protein